MVKSNGKVKVEANGEEEKEAEEDDVQYEVSTCESFSLDIP